MKVRLEKIRKELKIGDYREIKLNNTEIEVENIEPVEQVVIIEEPKEPLIVKPISNFDIQKPPDSKKTLQITKMDSKQRESYQQKLRNGVETMAVSEFKVRKLSGVIDKIRSSTKVGDRT